MTFKKGHPDYLPFPRTETHKKRISEAKMGHPVNKETRQKLSELRKGKTWEEIFLGDMGWTILRFWGTEIRDDLDGCVANVLEALPQ